jgi:hypothetical protein
MRQDEFQRQAKQWLSTYKREVLNVPEDGLWLRNGRPYEHILPQQKDQLNILASFRDEFWEWFRSQHIQLHSDFHHLNSSQALCFNLFFPLIMENGQGLATLLAMLSVANAPGGGASFEFQPDPIEGTCVDFSLPLQSGARVNFEVKYTESEFGSAKADDSHLRKFKSIYAARLQGRFEESFSGTEEFLKHYQIARNVWHLNEAAGDIAVFLFPKANTCLKQEEGTIRTCAVEPFRSRVHILYLEDLINELQREVKPQTTHEKHLQEFQLKYLPNL